MPQSYKVTLSDPIVIVVQWIRAMWFRILFAITAMALVHYFPSPSDASSEKVAAGGRNIPTYYFLLVIASTVLASFASTVQFVGISAFHTIIADPAVGGTYMTVCHISLISIIF